MKTKHLSYLGLFIALSMIFSYLETLIPLPFGIPGMKIGLANIVVVYVLMNMSVKEAFFVSLLRVLLIGILFQSGPAFFYSLAGAIVSLIVMNLILHFHFLDLTGTSIAGAVGHNLAQVAVAVFFLGSRSVFFYLPYLLISALFSGLAIGLLTAVLIRRFPYHV